MPVSQAQFDRALALLERVHADNIDVGPWGDDDGLMLATVCDVCGGTQAGALHKDDCYVKAIEDFLADPKVIAARQAAWDELTQIALRRALEWLAAGIGDTPLSDKARAGIDWAQAVAERDESALTDAQARWKGTLEDPAKTMVGPWACVCGYSVWQSDVDKMAFAVGEHKAKCDAWVSMEGRDHESEPT